jgi:2'-5' RNA ligase
MRLFVAVELPGDVRDALAGLVRRLPSDGVKWGSPSTFHVTVRFLGAVDPPEPVAEALVATVARFGRLRLRLSGGGAFPSPQRPRILWAGVTGDVAALGQIGQAMDEALAPFGIVAEERAFRPHVTLGRVKHGRPRPEALYALGEVGDIDVRELILFASETRPEGAVHTVYRRLPLA